MVDIRMKMWLNPDKIIASKKSGIRRFLWVIFFIFIQWVRFHPEAGEKYARTIYPVMASVLSSFSRIFPFSLGDCFIYGSIAGLTVYLVYALTKRTEVWRRLRFIAEYLAWVYVWFYLAWGLNYFRQDFFTRSGIPSVPYSAERFASFLETYTDSLNASYVSLEKIDTFSVAATIQEGYSTLSPRFGLLRPAGQKPPAAGKHLAGVKPPVAKEHLTDIKHPAADSLAALRLRAKPMLFPSWMSGVGVMGYIGPFFNEFNLNTELLPVQYPAVYAHELSHVLGISNEAEANLYSYLVCTASDRPEVRFSGYFSLFPYVLGNAYRLLDKEAFEAWKAKLRPEIKELYNRKTAYWQARYSPWIGKIQDTAYNLFLKGNRISSGTANYSEVIELVIACHATGENFVGPPAALLSN